jgi:hypothetical protein
MLTLFKKDPLAPLHIIVATNTLALWASIFYPFRGVYDACVVLLAKSGKLTYTIQSRELVRARESFFYQQIRHRLKMTRACMKSDPNER